MTSQSINTTDYFSARIFVGNAISMCLGEQFVDGHEANAQVFRSLPVGIIGDATCPEPLRDTAMIVLTWKDTPANREECDAFIDDLDINCPESWRDGLAVMVSDQDPAFKAELKFNPAGPFNWINALVKTLDLVQDGEKFYLR